MRPGQNKRMRGRNNRRGPNPLTRSYESNGPDVKIRGTAAHVAEKYVQLARDAHASGDPVMAESYLQHAEHYLRLIAAAQAQQFAAQQAAMSGGRVEDSDDFEGDDEFESSVMDRFTFRAPQSPNPPGFEGGEQPRQDYQPRQENRQERQENRQEGRQDNRQDGRQDQPRENRDFRRDRDNRRERFDRNAPRPERQPQPQPQPQPETPDGEAALPSFITAPVRIPIETAAPGTGEQPEVGDLPIAADGEEGAGRFPLRARRRRRRGPRDGEGGEAGGEGEAAAAAADAPATSGE